MRLLISLCNSTPDTPEALVTYDTDSGTTEGVKVEDPGHGVFGLAVCEATVYCVADRGRATPDGAEHSELVALDASTLSIRWRYTFKVARDVHSIVASRDRLFAASTGTDEVVELSLDSMGRVTDERVYWRVEQTHERRAGHHMNSLAFVDGHLLVSGFGPRPAEAWKDAIDGFVLALPSGDRVMRPTYHPHSICALEDGELALCESPRRRVVTSRGRASWSLPGYARGMCLVDDQ